MNKVEKYLEKVRELEKARLDKDYVDDELTLRELGELWYSMNKSELVEIESILIQWDDYNK